MEVRSRTATPIACLAHPASVAAMVVLAVNDHLLKGVGPGWITGKLSDFAGLFFFPYLVALVLSLALIRDGSRRYTGPIAFALAACWFAGAKTVPLVKEGTVALATWLAGPSTIVLDPTDLVALAVLWPAWRLYRRIESRPALSVPRLVHAPAVTFAAALCMATSVQIPNVSALIVHDGVLHAQVDDIGSFSTSDGMRWAAAVPLPKDVLASHQRRPFTDPAEPDLRYVSEDGEVRRFRDGDVTWSTEWRLPDGREAFMRVLGSWGSLGGHDVVALPGDPTILVAGMGAEGVVVRDAGGLWTRHAVGEAKPTPTQAELKDLAGLVARGQGAFGASSALLAWMTMSLVGWWIAMARARQLAALGSVARAPFYAGLGACVCCGPFTPMLFFARDPVGLWIVVNVGLIGIGALVLGVFVRSWRRVVSFDRVRASGPYAVSIAAAAVVGLIAEGLLIAWDLDVIQTRESALYATVATLVTVVAAFAFWVGIRPMESRARSEIEGPYRKDDSPA